MTTCIRGTGFGGFTAAHHGILGEAGDPSPACSITENQPPGNAVQPSEISRLNAVVVRKEVASAAIGAALLVYFGYFYGFTGGVTLAGSLLYYTLRIGAGLMVLSVLLLAWGRRFALAVDSAFALLIGAALIVSGVLWLIGGGGMQGIINILCGGFFAQAGWRSGALWLVMAGGPSPAGHEQPWTYDPHAVPAQDSTATSSEAQPSQERGHS